MINKARLIRLTQQLIRIDSQNPPGNESKIAKFVAAYLRQMGVRTKIYEFKKGRANVLAYLSGKDNRHSLLLTPHLDTVPAGKSWKRKPFAARIEKKRIYGLGATDCKGNLACALEAISSIVEEDNIFAYNLIFAATADEECGSKLGLVPLLEKKILAPDAAVVLDADEFDIIVAQKGLMHLKIKVQGKRAHGAYPQRGASAIDMAVDIIRAIKSHKFTPLEMQRRRRQTAAKGSPSLTGFMHAKNKYLKPPTANIGTIRGGDKVNIVADWCEFELDLRFLPGMQEKNILGQLNKIIQRHTKKFQIEIEDIQQPYNIGRRHWLVINLQYAMQRARLKPQIKGSEGATAITFFQSRNIPAIASGFGSRNCAHMSDEYIKVNNLYKGAIALREFFKKPLF